MRGLWLVKNLCFYQSLCHNPSYSRILIGHAYNLLEDRCTIDVNTTKFFPLCFKMAESFKNLEIFYVIRQKYKKSIVEALNRYEKHSLAGKRKIKPFLSLKMAQKKILEQSAVERDKPNTKLVLLSWEPLLNKPNKQNVYEIDSFDEFNFSQWQKILDTLIDV